MSDYTRNTLVWLLLIGGGIAAGIVTCLWSTAAADAEDEIDRELREMCDVPPR